MPESTLTVKNTFRKYLIKESSIENCISLTFINKIQLESKINFENSIKIAKVFVNTLINFNKGDEIIFLEDKIINNLRKIFYHDKDLQGVSKKLLDKIKFVKENQFTLTENDLNEIENEINNINLNDVKLNLNINNYKDVNEHINLAKKEINYSLNNSFIRFKDSKIFREVFRNNKLFNTKLEYLEKTNPNFAFNNLIDIFKEKVG